MAKGRRKVKMRRHHLKRFSSLVLKTRSSVDNEKLKDFVAQSSLRQAAGQSKFMTDDQYPLIQASRKETLARLRELRLELPIDRCIILLPGRFRRVKLYFNNDHTGWWIIEENVLLMTWKRSRKYNSKAWAVKEFTLNTITWVEELALPTLEELAEDV